MTKFDKFEEDRIENDRNEEDITKTIELRH